MQMREFEAVEGLYVPVGTCRNDEKCTHNALEDLAVYAEQITARF